MNLNSLRQDLILDNNYLAVELRGKKRNCGISDWCD